MQISQQMQADLTALLEQFDPGEHERLQAEADQHMADVQAMREELARIAQRQQDLASEAERLERLAHDKQAQAQRIQAVAAAVRQLLTVSAPAVAVQAAGAYSTSCDHLTCPGCPICGCHQAKLAPRTSAASGPNALPQVPHGQPGPNTLPPQAAQAHNADAGRKGHRG